MEINSTQDFDGILSSEKPSLVDFYADWCGPCKAMEPTLNQINEQYTDRANVVKIDVDKNPDLANKYGIRNIPTMLFFKNGEMVKKITGTTTKKNIEDALNGII